jgi:hypothetical protein
VTRRENEKMFYVVIVGFAGALIMFAGDMLLYYTPEDFAYDSKSSSTAKMEKIPRFFYIYKLRDACGMMPVWKTATRNYAVCFVMWMM